MKLPIVELPPFSRYFILLKSKYSPQDPVSQPVEVTESKTAVNYTLLISSFYVF
jgi:hypothetical protein